MRKGPILAQLSLGAIFAYAVFQRGGVDSAHWNRCLLALAILAIAYTLRAGPSTVAPPMPRFIFWPLLLLPPYVALQLIPLPTAVLRILSPARAHLVDSVAGILPATKWAPLSVVPAVTLEQLFNVLAYLTVFLLLREFTWRTSSRPWIVVSPILAVTACEALFGLTQAFSGDPEAMAKGTYVNRNHFSGLIGMALPFAVAYPVAILRKHSRRLGALPLLRASLGFVLAALLLTGILYSFSRMGFFASLLSLVVIVVLAIRSQLSAAWKWLSASLVIAVIIVVFIFLSPAPLIERFATFTSSETLSAEGRLSLWRESRNLIGAYPLFGCGLGGYEAALHKYKFSHAMFSTDYAHNDYLQFLAELGVCGFALTMALAIALLVKALRTHTNSKNIDKRYLALGCVGSFVAIGLHSLADFNLYIPANAMLLAWIGGIAAGVHSRSSARRSAQVDPEYTARLSTDATKC